MRRKDIVFLILLMFIFISIQTVKASGGLMTGFGDDFPVITGISSIYSNPAAVNGSEDSFGLELDLAGQFWNNLLMNDYIDDSEKDKLLSKLEDSGLIFAGDMQGGGKLKIGFLTAFAGVRTDGLLKVSPDLAELLLKGNELDKEYDFSGTAGTGGAYLDTGVNLSYKMPASLAKNLSADELYLGLTYHYLYGTFFKTWGSGTASLSHDGNLSGEGEFKGIYTDQEAPGQSFDLGLYADYGEKYKLGFSLMNLGGKMTADSYKLSSYQAVYDQELGEWQPNETEEQQVNEEIEYKLPLIVRAGLRKQQSDNLALMAAYTYTSYNDEIFEEKPVDHRFSTAAEYSGLKFLPLRAGVNYSTLQHDFDVSAGLGLYLGALKMDFGISDLLGLVYRSKGVKAGLSARIEF